jgi:hypothetical protein
MRVRDHIRLAQPQAVKSTQARCNMRWVLTIVLGSRSGGRVRGCDRSDGKLPAMHPLPATVSTGGRMLAVEDAGPGCGFAALDASVPLGSGACDE